MKTKKELSKNYEHITSELKIYALWEKSGFFNPDKLPKSHKQPFSIIMPPTNANDPLHIGHALVMTIEDIMTRYNRMQGKKTLWLPGLDHAGFETQVVYEKKLAKLGRSRFDMTREQFYQEVWDYTQKNSETIRGQIKKLGASCDWSRETFTLDDKVVQTVYDTFKQMTDEGLIYRAERLVNYCTKHRTAFSELEIVHEERKDPLYYIKYGPITLATVRPETKFGDTAIAVHPKDKRYQQYIGKEIEVETLVGKKMIKIIADDVVDPEFGTGAVKVTPAHDQTDFEIWQRHKDEIPGPIQVIGQDGKLTEVAGPYAGMKVEEARKKVAEDMQHAGLLEKTNDAYEHTVSLCYKCNTVLEPMLMKQWFISMQPLAQRAIKAAQKKEVIFVPANQKKIYLHWLNNIKDWNISRQNWWGIEIPAWRCVSCAKLGETQKNILKNTEKISNFQFPISKQIPNHNDQNINQEEGWIITNGEKPKKCPNCGGTDLLRDPDVFDTWFSSGQWPYATLGYPNGKDFKAFYPTSVMETGYDILFFWVARMIMLGIYRTGKVPFKTVYLHGLVRDKDRQKMSKSKGNVIDPLGIVEVYGADALRMALIVGNLPGRDSALSEDKIRGYRNFTTKLWNITRFILMNCQDYSPARKVVLSPADKKILKDFDRTRAKVTKNMEALKFSHAAEMLYHYSWHTFADKIIEESKPLLQEGTDAKKRAARQHLLIRVLADTLKLLHPFMPFVTEELFASLPLEKHGLLMVEKWPE